THLIKLSGVPMILFWSLFGTLTFAQQPNELKGVVRDALTSEVLQGVTVKSGSKSTQTDANGSFTLQVALPATLDFSLLGKKSKQEVVNQNKSLIIFLEADDKDLEEVVVVGYGVQKKTSLTAAVGTLKGDEVKDVPATNLTNTLGG